MQGRLHLDTAMKPTPLLHPPPRRYGSAGRERRCIRASVFAWLPPPSAKDKVSDKVFDKVGTAQVRGVFGYHRLPPVTMGYH
jgi:hypothetical protein